MTLISYDLGYTTKTWYFHKPSPNTGRWQKVAGRCPSLTKGKRKGTMRLAEGVEEIDHIHEWKWHNVGDSSKSFLRRNEHSLPFPSTVAILMNSRCAVGLSVLRWFYSPACIEEWGRAPEHVCWINLHLRTGPLQWTGGHPGWLSGSGSALTWLVLGYSLHLLLLSLLKCKTNAFHQMALVSLSV